MHRAPEAMQTATYSVFTYVSSSSSYKTKTNLLGTFYTLNDTVSGYYSICAPAAKQKVTLSTKKTTYAKLSTGSVSYSLGCGAPTIFRGTVYDLTAKKAAGSYDSFVDTISGHVVANGEKYIYNLVLDVTVAIGS